MRVTWADVELVVLVMAWSWVYLPVARLTGGWMGLGVKLVSIALLVIPWSLFSMREQPATVRSVTVPMLPVAAMCGFYLALIGTVPRWSSALWLAAVALSVIHLVVRTCRILSRREPE